MKELTLHFDITPIGIQSVRFGKNGPYQDKKAIAYKKSISIQAMEQLPANFQMWTGAIAIEQCYFLFSPPKNMAKYLKNAIADGWNVYKSTKPDVTDNLFKGVIDALEGIVYKNDSQICMLDDVKKMYTVGSPGIMITFRQVDNRPKRGTPDLLES